MATKKPTTKRRNTGGRAAPSENQPRRHQRLGAALVLVAVLVAGLYLLATRTVRASWPAAVMPRGNVLLVTLDTVRADRIRLPEGDPITPTLGRLMREGRVYTSAYTHAPLTLPAHASILTGLHPPAHGVRGNGTFRLDAAHATLAERLRTAGYSTAAFVGAFVLDARFGLDQGFDVYSAVPDERPFAQDFAFAERRADAVLADAERWVTASSSRDRTQPWFAWIHLFDAHAPYDAPITLTANAYENEIAFTDRQLGIFFDRLRARGELDRTLTIVTADHGEGLGEHGERTHGLFAYDSTMRVPLVVHGPGIGHGIHDALASHVDIVPTVLDVIGFDAVDTLTGRSLRDLSVNRDSDAVTYLEAMDGWLTAGAAPLTAIVGDSWKYIELPEPELYDLASDPSEQRNRQGGELERARAMSARLAPLVRPPGTASSAMLDSDAASRLRSLGYFAGAPGKVNGHPTLKDDPKAVRPLYERFLDVLASREAGRIDELMRIVEARPTFVAAQLTAASMLIENGRAGEAVALLETSGRAAEAPLPLRERFGAALLGAGRLEHAEQVLTDIVQDPQASADAWNALGVVRATRGRPSEAVVAFDRAVVLAPGAARFQFNRALAHRDAGDMARSRDDLVALTGRHPAFADGWRALADMRYRAGDRTGAIEAWRKVVTLVSTDSDAWSNLAVALRELGRFDEAREIEDRRP